MYAFKPHFIHRDSTEKYVALFLSTDQIKVFSLADGSEKTVAFVNRDDNGTTIYSADYLTGDCEVLKFFTYADTTIVINKTKIPAMGAVTPKWNPFAIINVLHGVAGVTYTITINGTSYDYTAGSTTDYDSYSTQTISTALYESLLGWIDLQTTPSDWKLVEGGSCILIFNTADEDFTLVATDTWGNVALAGIKEQAQKVEDLPNRMPDAASYPTDVFTVQSYAEYWMNVLLVGDPNGDPNVYSPGNMLAIGVSVSSYGHQDMSLTESMNDWETCLRTALIDHEIMYPNYGNMNGRTSTVADQFHSDSWVITRDSNTKLSVYRTDGVRTTLWCAKIHFQDGNWDASCTWTDPYITRASHEAVDFDGLYVKVYDSKKTGDTGYYLKWETEADTRNATGAWVETVAGGIANAIDPANMPHQLVRIADGSFEFKELVWENRMVGDEDSAPNPSCIGQTITDVFFHKNRLGLLTDKASVVLSQASDYFNLYPTSAMEVLDDDPIDVEIITPTVSILQWGVSNDDDLFIFGGGRQYLITSGDQIFSPKTVACTVGTNFPVSGTVQPLRCGANLYLFAEKDDYGAVYEYYTVPQTLTSDATDVTAHVPRLLPENIWGMTASPEDQMLITWNNTNTLWCYKYYWSGQEKVQSAWFKWTFPYDIKAARIMGGTLYLLGDLSNTLILTKMRLERQMGVEHTDATSADAGTNISMSFTFSRFGVPTKGANVYEKQGRLQLRTLTLAGSVPEEITTVQYHSSNVSVSKGESAYFLETSSGLLAALGIAVDEGWHPLTTTQILVSGFANAGNNGIFTIFTATTAGEDTAIEPLYSEQGPMVSEAAGAVVTFSVVIP